MKENLGVLLYENAQPMDIIGPWEVFSFWKNILHARINLYLISEKDLFVQCVNDIILKAHANFNTSPKLDYLLVPGGSGRLKQVNNENLISYIKKQSEHCKYILSDCTGMFLLYAAGLLHGKSATTYWRALPELKAFPDVTTIEERIVKSDNIWTAGGVSSGIDLAFELIAEIAGKETAGKVQLLFEYFPKNKMYCTADLISSLPPYQDDQEIAEPHLPAYIREAIDQFRDE